MVEMGHQDHQVHRVHKVSSHTIPIKHSNLQMIISSLFLNEHLWQIYSSQGYSTFFLSEY